MSEPTASRAFSLRDLAAAVGWWALVLPVVAAGLWLAGAFSPTEPWWPDRVVLEWLAAHRTPELDRLFAAVTWAGSLYVLGPLAGLILLTLLWRGRGCDGLLLALGLGVAALASSLLKDLVARLRPDLFPPLIATPGDGSFPSGHATQIAAFALAVIFLAHRRGWRGQAVLAVALALLILLVGASRMYLQVHYPTDVLAGLLLGLAWVLGLERLTPWIGGGSRPVGAAEP